MDRRGFVVGHLTHNPTWGNVSHKLECYKQIKCKKYQYYD